MEFLEHAVAVAFHEYSAMSFPRLSNHGNHKTLFKKKDIAPVSTSHPWNALNIEVKIKKNIRKFASKILKTEYDLQKYEEEKCNRAVVIPWPECDQLQGRRETYNLQLAIVRYPSLSIDLLYDFKEVQPMPNHSAVFSSLPI